MSQAVRLNATMDEDLLRRLDAYARDHYEDRSRRCGSWSTSHYVSCASRTR